MAEKKGKLTFKVALFGVLGSGALAYALLRRPRYLFDGRVLVCEGSAPVYGLDQSCTELVLTRGDGSGKVIAPFTGKVRANTGSVLTIESDTKPILFHFSLNQGAPTVPVGQSFKAGDVIAQAERVKVTASRKEGDQLAPVAPSAWLIANSLLPASQVGTQWCEDSYQVIVPQCSGVTFRPPELPKWSMRTIRMTM